MGGTPDKRPWSGKGPDEVRPRSQIPTGQGPVHPSALLIPLLAGHDLRLLYTPARTVHHASRGYRGDGKTDAKNT
ncbi:hypothetical protein [Streptomyces sp. NPDC058279]|uniref:hypothetical protein n=1 Tax=Streptomyces sp. NPDC058279 TaxID=3346418 RepID=UPI0036EE9B6E